MKKTSLIIIFLICISFHNLTKTLIENKISIPLNKLNLKKILYLKLNNYIKQQNKNSFQFLTKDDPNLNTEDE